jgi:ABC-type transport system substrate-binding protein
LLSLAATACGGGGSSDSSPEGEDNTSVTLEAPHQAPEPGGRMVYGLIAETDGWHPGQSRWAASGTEVAKAFYDTLSAYDENLEIQPFLAEAFVPNEDFTEWTIKMREGVTFHDGAPADAEAVKFNIDWHRESPLTSPPFQLVVDTIVDDPLSLRVTLSETWVTFPNAFATQIGVLASPAMLDSPDGARHPVGTGPFVFDEWTPDATLVVTKNDDYWQEGYPYLDEIEFRPITDPVGRKAALETGEIDIAQISVPGAIRDFTDQAEQGNYQVFIDEKGEVAEDFVQLNTAVPPFDDLVARQALAYATDKDLYNQTIGEGLYEVANSPYQKRSQWHVDVDYPQYDPVKAQELVDEYKAAHGGEFAFDMTGTASTRNNRSLLKEMYEDVGIDVSLSDTEQGQLIVDVLTGDYQATTWAQFDAPNPVADSIWWLCDTVKPVGDFALNFARNCNEKSDAAFQKARQTADREEQKEQYAVVQREMAKDLPYIWLYHNEVAVVSVPGFWDITTWETPNGKVGLPLQNATHPLFQIWTTEQ